MLPEAEGGLPCNKAGMLGYAHRMRTAPPRDMPELLKLSGDMLHSTLLHMPGAESNLLEAGGDLLLDGARVSPWLMLA